MAEALRLDRHLVKAGLARSRAQALELVREGRVVVDGQVRTRPASVVTPGQAVAVTGEVADWVGRGAVKLAHALELWGPEGLTVQNRRCLDVGASTGGFTQVLLRHGASHVTALDVGHGQLVAALADDPRVRDLPGTNVREVTVEVLGGRFEVVVADLSFISLTSVLRVIAGLCVADADLVLLVKPQFEVGRQALGKGGVVRSGRDRARALHRVVEAARDAGLGVRRLATSPVTGSHGNTEYLVWLSPRAPGMMSTPETAGRIAELTEEEPS